MAEPFLANVPERERGQRSALQRLAILGSTGSIGRNTLEVARHFPGRFDIVGLAAHSRWEELFAQAREFHPAWVVLTDPDAIEQADRALLPPDCKLLHGQEALQDLVARPEVDTVVSAIVGAAGLHSTWAALKAGKKVALANKETLVVAGAAIVELLKNDRGRLLPVDSEHSAIFQALADHPVEQVRRVVLTASGGPFRGRKRDSLEGVTAEEALNHPTWKMGPKITIDSATLMNKALEIIEAHWLFGLSAEQIEVIVHPESIVHSFVEFVDGSVMAQLSPPDMKLPIQYALLYPERASGPARRLEWDTLNRLHFEAPDRAAFESLDLGYEVIRGGGTCGAILNAANEAAVARFLVGEIGFLDIGRIAGSVLRSHNHSPKPTLEELLAADCWARREVVRWKRL